MNSQKIFSIVLFGSLICSFSQTHSFDVSEPSYFLSRLGIHGLGSGLAFYSGKTRAQDEAEDLLEEENNNDSLALYTSIVVHLFGYGLPFFKERVLPADSEEKKTTLGKTKSALLGFLWSGVSLVGHGFGEYCFANAGFYYGKKMAQIPDSEEKNGEKALFFFLMGAIGHFAGWVFNEKGADSLQEGFGMKTRVRVSPRLVEHLRCKNCGHDVDPKEFTKIKRF